METFSKYQMILMCCSFVALICFAPPLLFTLLTKREINNKCPAVWRAVNRYRLDQMQGKNKLSYGFTMFCGKQGGGKTYSAVQYSLDICRREGALLVSNTPLNVPKDIEYMHISDISELYYLPEHTSYVYLLDEIQTLFNVHNFDKAFYTVFCQLRKRNIKLVSTCQVFERCALPLREQVSELYGCRTYFGCITKNTRYSASLNSDGKLSRKDIIRLGTKWYIQNDETRSAYDTYFKI